jgi:hypothetical protein
MTLLDTSLYRTIKGHFIVAVEFTLIHFIIGLFRRLVWEIDIYGWKETANVAQSQTLYGSLAFTGQCC